MASKWTFTLEQAICFLLSVVIVTDQTLSFADRGLSSFFKFRLSASQEGHDSIHLQSYFDTVTESIHLISVLLVQQDI